MPARKLRIYHRSPYWWNQDGYEARACETCGWPGLDEGKADLWHIAHVGHVDDILAGPFCCHACASGERERMQEREHQAAQEVSP